MRPIKWTIIADDVVVLDVGPFEVGLSVIGLATGTAVAVREGLDRYRQSRTKLVFGRRARTGDPISGSDRHAGLGDTLYRIHGTNRPGSIGGAVSHGCFRMHNAHIIELYERCKSERIPCGAVNLGRVLDRQSCIAFFQRRSTLTENLEIERLALPSRGR